MASLLTIELKQLRFFGYHGVFAEEQKIGNEFEVNLSVSFEPGQGIIDDLSGSVDYADIFELVKTRMRNPEALLETLAMSMAGEIHTVYPIVKHIDISITKIHAPVPGLIGQVGIRFQKDYP